MEENMKNLESAKIDEVDMDGVAGGRGFGTDLWEEKRKEKEYKPKINGLHGEWEGGDSCNQKMDDDLKNWGSTNQN